MTRSRDIISTSQYYRQVSQQAFKLLTPNYPQPRMTGLLSRTKVSSSLCVESKLNFSVTHWPLASTEKNNPSARYSGTVIPFDTICCFSRSQSSFSCFVLNDEESGGMINTVLLK